MSAEHEALKLRLAAQLDGGSAPAVWPAIDEWHRKRAEHAAALALRLAGEECAKILEEYGARGCPVCEAAASKIREVTGGEP